MATAFDPRALAVRARRFHVETLLAALPQTVQSVAAGARALIEQIPDPVAQYRRRDTVIELDRASPPWLAGMTRTLGTALASGMVPPTTTRGGGVGNGSDLGMTLVDNDTIEIEIIGSRLALAMMDRSSWEFADLRSRMLSLERRDELDPNDALRPHVLSRIVTTAWHAAGLSQDVWRFLQPVLHEEFSHLAEAGYHETNHWLLERRVLPDVDLRPLIRRSANAHAGTVSGFETPAFGTRDSRQGALGSTDAGPASAPMPAPGHERAGAAVAQRASEGSTGRPQRDDAAQRNDAPQRGDTQLMTQPAALGSAAEPANALLARLNRTVAQVAPGFALTVAAHLPSPALGPAIDQAQRTLRMRLVAVDAASPGGSAVGIETPQLVQEMAQRQQALKKAAGTPVERATIEIVALLFQSLLTEERIPAGVRVWFARLQMPVLRVAIGEPDFFAAADHPARRLIDRMGACVMGFDASARLVGDALQKEIKRVVQVVEAYPDTGRRVFQTVLSEFEQFLEHYFRNENEATKKGVSLAQQIEQRETLAIQYTIELRRMLDQMPVQDGVRDFLFQVWADVLAMTALKQGAQSDATKVMKRAAADLIWSAGAKVSREERSEVIRKLPPLLKTLREAMVDVGIAQDKQEEHLRQLNNALAAAFTAKAAAIPQHRLDELTARLDTLEDLLPDARDVPIDDAMMRDLSGHESDTLEVVGEGGAHPTPASVAWAQELAVGGWYMLDYRGRNEPVQLAWHGLRRHLTLFVSPQGRGILFQQQRLAAFLEARLLLPAEEESLTVRATRTALAKLDADPTLLLS